MGKRGSSHIEMILSFIIFIGAVFAALYFFSPTNETRLVDSTLEYTFREVRDYTIAPYEKYVLKISGIGDADKDKNLVVELGVVADGWGARVTSGGVENDYYLEDLGDSGGATITIAAPGDGWNSVSSVEIALSDEFDVGDNSISGGLENSDMNTYYTIASVVSKDLYSELDFRALAAEYGEDYDGLRGDGNFNLPRRVNFGFLVDFEPAGVGGEDILATKQKPDGADVFANSERVEVLRESGEVEFAELVVEIW